MQATLHHQPLWRWIGKTLVNFGLLTGLGVIFAACDGCPPPSRQVIARAIQEQTQAAQTQTANQSTGQTTGSATNPLTAQAAAPSAIEATGQAPSTALPATTDEMVIYIDTSHSMKGYVSADGQSVFSRTLRTLREFSTTLAKPVEVKLRTVEAQVGPPQPNAVLVRASTDAALYQGTETNLVGALATFSQPLPQAKTATATPTATTTTNPPPPTVSPAHAAASAPSNATASAAIPRFHILVTDGVQSMEKGSQATNSADACAAGADAWCVRKRMLALLAQGWSGTVLGLRSQFCCEFYSEQLRRNVPYKTAGRNTADYRPFYLYVFSPERAALDELVGRLKDSLRQAQGQTALSLQELPLSSAYTAGGLQIELPTGFQTTAPGQLSCQKIGGGGTTGAPLFLSLPFKVAGQAVRTPFQLTFSLPWSARGLDVGKPAELAQLLKWELQPVYPTPPHAAERYPEIEFDLQQIKLDEQGRFVLAANARWPLAGGRACWRAYRLTARLNQDAEPAWVRGWSTDRDTQPASGNRTLDLTIALLGVWRNPQLAQQTIAEAYLRIGPQ